MGKPAKPLGEMTLDELWELFPVVLVPHRVAWVEWARDEIEGLSDLLGRYAPVIHHIGSTAVPGICAKPIVDILVEVDVAVSWNEIRTVMESAEYICMSVSDGRISFNKGYTPQGYAERVFHIHFHRTGDCDEVLFRDYLISHPHAARDYEQLKLSLASIHRHNRDAYTAAKTPFIQQILAQTKHGR